MGIKLADNTAQNSSSYKHYDSIDGLRAFAAIGIVMMHMKANTDYQISGVVYNTVIPFFTAFVFLFMIVSGFSMCCGYYEKISSGKISISSFYEKRYAKIWPYFALLVFIDIIMNPSISSITEAFADLTLAFGLLPNAAITVIGVGWFIGVAFLFYMLFPFFCFLLKTPKRAWFALAVCILYNIVCTEYFMDSSHVAEGFVTRSNFIYCAMFFMSGCIIYLYRDKISSIVSKFRFVVLGASAIITIGYFFLPKNDNISNICYLVMFGLYLCYAIGTNGVILNNPVTKFLASLSMEIYLTHMVIFRVTENLHLNYIFGIGWISYIFTVVMVLISATIFALAAKWFLAQVGMLLQKVRK